MKGLYNIRIIRSYLEYIEKYYHDINIDEVLESTGLTRAELADDGYWCTQEQVDGFQETVVRLTRNPYVARDAGRYTISTKAYRTVLQYTFGFISPSTAYLLSAKIGAKLTRGAILSSRALGTNKMEMISKPAPGIEEKEYQCWNRIGHIEALAAAFTGKFATVEHPKCFHKGDEECKYIISWAEPLFLKLQRIRNIIFISSLFILVFFSLFLSNRLISPLSVILFSLVAVSTLISWYYEKKEYKKQVADQARTAELLMLESNIRSNNEMLIHEIGQAISSVLDADTLIKKIMETLKDRLEFDRGTVLLANEDKTILQYSAGYGFSPDQEAYFKRNNVHVDVVESSDPFVVAYKNMKPLIIESVQKDLEERSRKFSILSGASSYICVPIIFEKHSLGVLYVDRISTVSPLTQSDMDIIMGIAPQIAISLNNAWTYEKLETSEIRYRGILEDMEEIYYEVDLEGRFTFFNASITRTYNFPENELLGVSYKSFMSKADAERLYRAAHDVFLSGGGTIKAFEWRITRNNQEMYLEASVSIRKNAQGVPIGFRGIVRNVTQRKQSEDALKKSEERYRIVAQNARDVIWIFDFDTGFTYISPSIERLRGYTPEEAMKQTLDEILTEDSYERAREILQKELTLEVNGKRHELDWSQTLELEMVCKDGSTVWTEVAVNIVYDETNKRKGIMGITRDISERIKSSEEKNKLVDQLSHAQKMESIGTLAGGIAHDFNNLLTGILGNVSLAIMKMEEGNPIRERLKNIEEYVQRGSDLTKQLLGFARGGKYEVKPTNLVEFIRKSSEMFGRTKKEISICHTFPDDLWLVEVDRGQMDQVLLNLFVNAWHAMPDGGTLQLSAENVELGVTDVVAYNIRPGKFVKTTVADSGTGMDEATKARIFEPFFTTKERGRGTGLGLASVYGIINNHGGFITVESKKGIGTSFMIYLPASDKKIEENEKFEDDIQRGTETILLIDDEEMILDTESKMLEGLGYKVLTAVGGRKGVQIYEKEVKNIDLVILDMIMPEYSGKETYATLRMINPTVKVLLASGYSLTRQAKEIMQNGCKGFLPKPFTMEVLSKKVRDALS